MSYLASLFGYKLSILLLYLRIFGVNNTFRYFTWLTIFFVFGYLCSNFFTQLFGCTPPNKYWHSSYPGHCIDYTIAGLAYGSMNFISGLIILILPLPMIWHLQLSRKQKIGISIICMAGAGYAAQIHFIVSRINRTDLYNSHQKLCRFNHSIRRHSSGKCSKRSIFRIEVIIHAYRHTSILTASSPHSHTTN